MTENNDKEASDTNASELINKVFDMPLQSYDNFISEFMYLTKGNNDIMHTDDSNSTLCCSISTRHHDQFNLPIDDIKQSNLTRNTPKDHVNGQNTQLQPLEYETELSEEVSWQLP